MCRACVQKDLLFEKKVNEAAKELFGTDDVVTNFVLVADAIDIDGDNYSLYACSPHQRAWQTKGLIQHFNDYVAFSGTCHAMEEMEDEEED